jgi:hypothetical protein
MYKSDDGDEGRQEVDLKYFAVSTRLHGTTSQRTFICKCNIVLFYFSFIYIYISSVAIHFLVH